MKVAITGATGFIGRYLVEQVLAAGHECRCWYRPQSNRGDLPEAVEWVAGTLGQDAAAVELLQGCDAVIHSALDRPGEGFRGSEGDIVEFAQTNIIGSLQLIRQAQKQGGIQRFVQISTCAVHEKIREDRPLDEHHACTPMTHYGAHKAALEMFVHSYGWGEGFPICALRPTGVYGVNRPVEASKWYSLVKRIVAGKKIECRRGGKEVHALDVARAAVLLLDADGTDGECFNCYDRYVSEFEVAMLASEMVGGRGEIVGDPKSPKHQIVTSKLQRLGMQFGGEELLRSTVSELVEAARTQASN